MTALTIRVRILAKQTLQLGHVVSQLGHAPIQFLGQVLHGDEDGMNLPTVGLLPGLNAI